MISPRTSIFPAVLALLSCTVLAAGPGDPLYYRKQATWYETMLVSKEALSGKREEGYQRLGVRMSRWRSVGPFLSEKPFDEDFGPETQLDLGVSYGSSHLRWVEHPEWMDDVLIDLPAVPKSANYLCRSLITEEERPVTLFLGSDDGIKVWLNGDLVLEHRVDRGCQRNQEVLAVRLRKRENTLLLKVNNGGGPSAFYFSLLDLDPAILWKLLRRDFSLPVEVEEMDWEQADGIWGDQLTLIDYQVIADRYLAAAAGIAAAIERQGPGEFPPVSTPQGLWEVRTAYLSLHREEQSVRLQEATALTLTPKPPPEPRIHGPKVFGVRPGNPFLYTIPATGERPITFDVENLPAGLTVDRSSGMVTGSISRRGEYPVVLKASNARGEAVKPFRIVVGGRIALTPPLGWNSWNCFGCAVDEKSVRAAADAMVRSGLRDYGWSYINIDDCWEIQPGSADPALGGELRDAEGRIRTNKKFPDMKALSEYVHSLGLKFGIYSSPGPLTCAGYAATYQYELQDARQYAEWGVDYLKYDWCSYGQLAKDQSIQELQKPYRIMRAALDSVRRDIVYSLCQYGMGAVWEWGADVGGNSWRTTGDITDTWESMSSIGFSQAGHEPYAGPGHWNDPDMLVVGYVGWGPNLHPSRLTPEEQRTHITLWALLASPLLIGCDMARLDDFTLGLLTNAEVLDMHQDPLGRQAARISQTGSLEVWARELENGSLAVGFFNRGEKKDRVTVTWPALKITGEYRARDLWRQADIGTVEGTLSIDVARHGAMLISLTREGENH